MSGVYAVASKNRRVTLPILSFAIPVAIMVAGLVVLGVTPFGEHSLAIADGKAYVYGLSDFARLFTGEEDWLYSLHGLGGNRWSNLSWGGIHPVKLLALFATMETTPVWFTWISVVNLALCGLSMYALLAYLRGHRASNLVFSTSYALIGFNVANCYQMLFFAGPQLLPLMVLGLVKLVRGKSPLTYTLSLAACVFLNFYFGFHLCVVSLVIFVAYMLTDDRSWGVWRRLLVTWLAATAIAGLLPAFFWLPALKAFSGGGRLNQTGLSEFVFRENMPFVQMFSKLFSGANSFDEMINGLPNIFCGILVVALAILYFMSRRVEARRRKAAGLVLIFYLLTFYITALTLVMHGGTHTNWFPYRYSYVFSFLLIMVAFEEFEHLGDITPQDAKRCGVVLLFSAILVFGTSYSFVSAGSVLLDFGLLGLMWYVFCKYKGSRRAFITLLVALVSANMLANYVLSIQKVLDADGSELDLSVYESDASVYGAATDAVRQYDGGLYRMEKDYSDLGSVGADPMFYNYNGVSDSGPAIRAFVHEELSRLGVNWFDMRHWYSYGIPAATDSLLGLKYLVTDRDLAEEKGYSPSTGLADDIGTSIYENPSALPISILANRECEELALGDNAFENLNDVWKAMTGRPADVFVEQQDVAFTLHNNTETQSITKGEIRESTSNALAGQVSKYESSSCIEFSFVAQADGAYYAFDSSIPASSNGSEQSAMRFLGVFHAGEIVRDNYTIDYPYTGEDFRDFCAHMEIACANGDVLRDFANQLNARDITVASDTDSVLTGSLTAADGQCVLFTLPWDEGWTCLVDGEEVPINKTWDLFMSVDVPAGKHDFVLRFFPAWMSYGLAISGCAAVGLIAGMVAWKRASHLE